MFDTVGTLIAQSSFHYDPETDRQTVIQGEEVTTSWMNALGLPVMVQKGILTTTYEYDTCGNCLAITDGEGRATRQTFDPLRRLIHKELPDHTVLVYDYDLDSNLKEYRLPNNLVWKATYDGIGRKRTQELQGGTESSDQWTFTYENGYLVETKDPMQRTHTYSYDLLGRLKDESVKGWQRTYTYDPRGMFATAEQTSPNHHSLVERTYNADGQLDSESIYLNSELLQQTIQTWKPATRISTNRQS